MANPPLTSTTDPNSKLTPPLNPPTTDTSKSSLSSDSTAVNESQNGSSLTKPPNHEHSTPELDFSGEVATNNTLPTSETLEKIGNWNVLDEEGKAVPFKNIYTGPHVARRMLVIFIRHFFCGYCQDYLRSVASSISTESLLELPTPTFICVIGHGDLSLIPMYRAETNCPFPIYADPTKSLYDSLGLNRTLDLGPKPEYQRKDSSMLMFRSVLQSLKSLKGGGALKGGDYHQVGGEFLFEPLEGVTSPGFDTPGTAIEKDIGANGGILASPTSPTGGQGGTPGVEEKRVTWCHRMRTTRDHAEIPVLRQVLGLDPDEKWTSKRDGRGATSRSAKGEAEQGRASSVDLKREEVADLKKKKMRKRASWFPGRAA